MHQFMPVKETSEKKIAMNAQKNLLSSQVKYILSNQNSHAVML